MENKLKAKNKTVLENPKKSQISANKTALKNRSWNKKSNCSLDTPISRSVLLIWLCWSICSSIHSQCKISGLALQFFLIFCMKLEAWRRKSDKVWFLKKRSLQWWGPKKVPKMAQEWGFCGFDKILSHSYGVFGIHRNSKFAWSFQVVVVVVRHASTCLKLC